MSVKQSMKVLKVFLVLGVFCSLSLGKHLSGFSVNHRDIFRDEKQINILERPLGRNDPETRKNISLSENLTSSPESLILEPLQITNKKILTSKRIKSNPSFEEIVKRHKFEESENQSEVELPPLPAKFVEDKKIVKRSVVGSPLEFISKRQGLGLATSLTPQQQVLLIQQQQEAAAVLLQQQMFSLQNQRRQYAGLNRRRPLNNDYYDNDDSDSDEDDEFDSDEFMSYPIRAGYIPPMMPGFLRQK